MVRGIQLVLSELCRVNQFMDPLVRSSTGINHAVPTTSAERFLCHRLSGAFSRVLLCWA